MQPKTMIMFYWALYNKGRVDLAAKLLSKIEAAAKLGGLYRVNIHEGYTVQEPA